jgi:hypothetical protein
MNKIDGVSPMSRVSRVVHQFLLFLVLACGIAVMAFCPSREEIGLTAERLAAWWSPPKPRPIQRAQLGRAKRGFFDRLAAACPTRESAPAMPDVSRRAYPARIH